MICGRKGAKYKQSIFVHVGEKIVVFHEFDNQLIEGRTSLAGELKIHVTASVLAHVCDIFRHAHKKTPCPKNLWPGVKYGARKSGVQKSV